MNEHPGKDLIISTYGNRVRVRVCGILIRDEAVLMVRHHGLSQHPFWAPPGGGVEFGETLWEALVREFNEEVGIQVKQGRFLFVHEFISGPLHGLEFFYEIEEAEGAPRLGSDPEMDSNSQILSGLAFMTFGQLAALPEGSLHRALKGVRSAGELLGRSGLLPHLSAGQLPG